MNIQDIVQMAFMLKTGGQFDAACSLINSIELNEPANIDELSHRERVMLRAHYTESISQSIVDVFGYGVFSLRHVPKEYPFARKVINLACPHITISNYVAAMQTYATDDTLCHVCAMFDQDMILYECLVEDDYAVCDKCHEWTTYERTEFNAHVTNNTPEHREHLEYAIPDDIEDLYCNECNYARCECSLPEGPDMGDQCPNCYYIDCVCNAGDEDPFRCC